MNFAQEVTIKYAEAVPAHASTALRSDALVYIKGVGLFECTDADTYTRISKVMTPRGTWDSATTYTLYDIVLYQGSSYLALLTSINIIPGSDGTKWQLLAEKGNTGADGSSVPQVSQITFVIDGVGSPIATGLKGYIDIEFDCVITGWKLLADQVGSITLDVWRDSYANYPPLVGDSITASSKPSLVTSVKNQDLDLGDWSVETPAGSVFAVNVDSSDTVEKVTLTLIVLRS